MSWICMKLNEEGVRSTVCQEVVRASQSMVTICIMLLLPRGPLASHDKNRQANSMLHNY